MGTETSLCEGWGTLIYAVRVGVAKPESDLKSGSLWWHLRRNDVDVVDVPLTGY